MLDRTPRSLKRRGNPRKGMQHSRKPSRRDHLFRSSLRRCGGRFFSPSLGGVSSSQVTPIMSFFALVDPFVLPSPLVLFFFFFLLFFLDFVVYFLRKSIWFHEICGYGSDDRMNRSLSPWTHSGSSLSVFISESWSLWDWGVEGGRLMSHPRSWIWDCWRCEVISCRWCWWWFSLTNRRPIFAECL